MSDAGITEARILCATDGDGAPRVQPPLAHLNKHTSPPSHAAHTARTAVSQRLLVRMRAQVEATVFLGAGRSSPRHHASFFVADTEATAVTAKQHSTLLHRGYAYVRLVGMLLTGSLPAAAKDCTSEDLRDVLQAAFGAQTHPSCVFWRDLRLSGGRHVWSAVRNSCTPPHKAASGCSHFDYLAPGQGAEGRKWAAPDGHGAEDERGSMLMEEAVGAIGALRREEKGRVVPDPLERWAAAFLDTNDKSDPTLSFKELLQDIPTRQPFQDVMSDICDADEKATPLDAFAYLAATLAAVDLGVAASERQVSEKETRGDFGLGDPLEEFKASSRFTRVFLWALVCHSPRQCLHARAQRPRGDNPTPPPQSLWCPRAQSSRSYRPPSSRKAHGTGMFRHAADEDHDARARRAMRLLPVYAGMLTAVQSKGAIANLSKFQLYVAMLILLDKGGISDDAIAELRKMRVCAGPDTARRAILKSSLSLDAHFVMARRCHASRPPRPSATRLYPVPYKQHLLESCPGHA